MKKFKIHINKFRFIKNLILIITLVPLIILTSYIVEIAPVNSLGTKVCKEKYSLTLDIDRESERFICDYTDVNEEEEILFKFHTSYFSFIESTFVDSTYFEYSTKSGNFVSFDSTGYYRFNRNETFYISYKWATEEFKEMVRTNNCQLNILIGGTKYSLDY